MPLSPFCPDLHLLISTFAMAQKVALVTGGTRGIGYGISSVLASQEYSLVLGRGVALNLHFSHRKTQRLICYIGAGYNSNHDAAQQAKEELETQHGVKVVTVAGDISVPATVDALFQAVKARSFICDFLLGCTIKTLWLIPQALPLTLTCYLTGQLRRSLDCIHPQCWPLCGGHHQFS